MQQPLFRPTALDLALVADPTANRSNRVIAAAAKETAPSIGPDGVDLTQGDFRVAPDLHEATREGQIETAAASLAGGMIAAAGQPVTAAQAVETVREVMDELRHPSAGGVGQPVSNAARAAQMSPPSGSMTTPPPQSTRQQVAVLQCRTPHR